MTATTAAAVSVNRPAAKAGWLRAWYSSAYADPATPMLARLALSAELLARVGGVELVPPPPLPGGALDGLHCDAYLQAFLHGQAPLASSLGLPWTPALRTATLAMLAGQLAAAEHALCHGLAMNLARGFHHAVPERGSGYCALNGLALVAHHWPQRKVLVLDCDEHGGNGTEEFAARLPNLYNVSIFGTRFGCRGGERSWALPVAPVPTHGFGQYLRALARAEDIIAGVRPDLLLYQAGTDCHRDDPKGRTGLDTRQMFRRDLLVFRIARAHRLPVLFLVAGGYQSARRLARLNLNTVRAARACFGT